MSKNIMTSGIEMADVIKSTGFPVPEDMEGKTFAEVVEGGGGGGDITVEALSATENKVYTAPEGKAYSPVTVNVPEPSLADNHQVTLDVSNYSAPVEITPPSGKDGFKKATITLTDIPSPTTMYVWQDGYEPPEDRAYCVIPNPKVGDKVFWTDADSILSVATITAVTETTITTNRGTLTRTPTEDVVMIN